MPRDRIAPLERGNEARLPFRHRFGHGDGPEPGEWVARAEGAGHACPEMAAWVKPVVEQTQAEPILERLARGGRGHLLLRDRHALFGDGRLNLDTVTVEHVELAESYHALQ